MYLALGADYSPFTPSPIVDSDDEGPVPHPTVPVCAACYSDE
jgi:hypothetical protein